MPAKISKEICQRIYDLSGEGKPVKEIHAILKSEGIKISDKSVYNILKKKTNNQSLTSIEEEGFSETQEEEKDPVNFTLNNPVNNSFDESFSDNDTNNGKGKDKEEEEEKEIQIPKTLISLINQGVKEGTEQVKSIFLLKKPTMIT